MRKVLVVGLGGSGGKTLSFLMDELLTQLREYRNEDGLSWSKDDLPACWKFIHIDVPKDASSFGGNTVEDLKGQYVGLGDEAALYEVYDKLAFDKFKEATSGAQGLKDFARWRPKPSEAADIGISGGAGAFRAVGRVVTLARAESIYSALVEGAKKLFEDQSDADLSEVSALFGGEPKADKSPLILLVSSMAGGSGASMVLDVSDLLKGVGNEVPKFAGHNTAAFLYTSEVFKGLGAVAQNAGPGTLATISEVLSSATRRRNVWSEREWHALVKNAPLPNPMTTTGRGPKLFMPIGASAGGKRFGTTPDDVFRGFARVLAPLLNNSTQQEIFYEYVDTNFTKAVNLTPDLTGFSRELGDGAFVHPVFFSGFGSSKLSMGRDRYKEYAAQRIARMAINILRDGHIENSQSGNPVQQIQQAVESFYPVFLSAINMDGKASGTLRADEVRQAILGEQNSNTYIDDLANAFQKDFAGQGVVVAQALQVRLRTQKDRSTALADKIAKDNLLSWSELFLTKVENALMLAISQYGLQVAEEILKKFKFELDAFASQYGNITSSPEDAKISDFISKLTANKNAVTNDAFTEFRGILKVHFINKALRNAWQSRFVEFLSDFTISVIPELQKEVQRISKHYITVMGQPATEVSAVAFRDAPPTVWPTDSKEPPQYFNPAVNEVLLTNVEEFPIYFDQHVVAQTNQSNDSDALKEAAREILFRRMFDQSTGEIKPIVGWQEKVSSAQHPSLNRLKNWKPKRLEALQQAPQYSLELEFKDLKEYAHSWISRRGGAFEQFYSASIKSWLSQNSNGETIFQSALANAINYAQPLVTVDPNTANAFHGPNYYDVNYEFSEIPVSAGSAAIQSIAATWAVKPKGAENRTKLEAACDPASSTQVIYITGGTPPISPWVLSSLTNPIAESHKVGGKNPGWWRMVRSRTLNDFVPIASDKVDSFIRGYIIGRMTGRVVFDGNAPITIKVWVPDSTNPANGNWSAFRPEILGSAGFGLVGLAGAATGWNIPALLLESLPLAMVLLAPGDTERLTPYKELIRLGSNLKSHPELAENLFADQPNELDLWFAGETSLQSQLQKLGGAGETLKTASLAWLEELAKYARELQGARLDIDSEFWKQPAAFEISENLERAAQYISEELQRPDLGKYQRSEQVFTQPQVTETIREIGEGPEA